MNINNEIKSDIKIESKKEVKNDIKIDVKEESKIETKIDSGILLKIVSFIYNVLTSLQTIIFNLIVLIFIIAFISFTIFGFLVEYNEITLQMEDYVSHQKDDFSDFFKNELESIALLSKQMKMTFETNNLFNSNFNCFDSEIINNSSSKQLNLKKFELLSKYIYSLNSAFNNSFCSFIFINSTNICQNLFYIGIERLANGDSYWYQTNSSNNDLFSFKIDSSNGNIDSLNSKVSVPKYDISSEIYYKIFLESDNVNGAWGPIYISKSNLVPSIYHILPVINSTTGKKIGFIKNNYSLLSFSKFLQSLKLKYQSNLKIKIK